MNIVNSVKSLILLVAIFVISFGVHLLVNSPIVAMIAFIVGYTLIYLYHKFDDKVRVQQKDLIDLTNSVKSRSYS